MASSLAVLRIGILPKPILVNAEEVLGLMRFQAPQFFGQLAAYLGQVGFWSVG
jgi:hypothetical protein